MSDNCEVYGQAAQNSKPVEESDNVIIKLNVHDGTDNENQQFENEFFNYDPAVTVPDAYNEQNEYRSQPLPLITNKNQLKKTEHCMWCSYEFSNKAIGIPIKYVNEKYEVVGVFCSLECACACNFASNEFPGNAIDRYYLLNNMAHDMGHLGHVREAPPRTCLQKYGGNMTIEEFRNNNSRLHVAVSPMVGSAQYIMELNGCDDTKSLSYVPLNDDQVERAKNALKRKKPLHTSSISKTMNLIQINN